MWNPHLANQEEEGADFNEHLLGAGYTPGGQPTFSKLLSWKVVDPGVSDSLIHLPIHSFHTVLRAPYMPSTWVANATDKLSLHQKLTVLWWKRENTQAN